MAALRVIGSVAKGFPELREPARSLLECWRNDPDEEIREHARTLLAGD